MIEYKMNRNFIAKNLCINKVNPKLHCNGKCQMMKRLAEEEKQNSPNNTNSNSKEKAHEQIFCHDINKLTIIPLHSVTISYNQDPPFLTQDTPVSSVFHPPATS